MTKEITVIIEGLQLGEEAEAIKTTASGVYQYRNGKHFIHYDEKIENGKEITKNTIKISQSQIDIMKRGSSNSHMVFNLGEPTRSVYETPYGSLVFIIHTTIINVEEYPNEIRVKLQYTLSSENSHLSDNHITIKIRPSENN
jgi:uncharacterized beta-barrel protein YwiB (DUF1934 family)